MSLKDSWHFVPLDEILNVQGSTTFRDLYDLLSKRPNSGGFLIKTGERNNYVRAADFAADILRRAVTDVLLKDGLPKAAKDAVKARMAEITNTPVDELVWQAIREAPIVPVHRELAMLTSDEETLQDQHDLVFEVTEEGEKIGWYLNHEAVRETTTRKTVFVCGNTPSHDNTSADNGICDQCPWPIVGSRKV